jgi:hypothetical protein
VEPLVVDGAGVAAADAAAWVSDEGLPDGEGLAASAGLASPRQSAAADTAKLKSGCLQHGTAGP